MSSALYNADILRLAMNIPHLGRLRHPDATVEKRSPVCGSKVTVDVVFDAEGRVSDLAQEVKACALGQASAALMGQAVMGRTAADLAAARDALQNYLAGSRDNPGDWPGLDIFSEAIPHKARHASICLPFSAAAEAAEKAREDA